MLNQVLTVSTITTLPTSLLFLSIHSIHHQIAWLALLIAGVFGISKYLLESWFQYNNGPLQVKVQNPRFDLHNIEFPAVTVCSINKVNAVKANMLFDRMFGNNSDEEIREAFLKSLMSLSLLRFPYYHHPMRYNLSTNFPLFYDLKNEEIVDIMEKVNPTVSEMFKKCNWRGISFDCNFLFQRQKTEEGFCYAFNSKTADIRNISNVTFPYRNEDGKLEALRNNAAGKLTGLELLMKFPKKKHRLPQDKYRPTGYSIMVSSPESYPDSSRNIIINQRSNYVYRISVSVSETEGDSSLLHLDESVRGCTFDEKGSKGSMYLQSNCFLQCRKSEIYKHCQCIPYFLPHNPSM
ncbi:pickpocket protein 19-like [Lycorma delicatula]|uniref:pickpocket protein 19-like n=1 Tax=Lycorma delicatula TaxID=130591 RepID=UPI003F50EE2B